MWQAAINGGAQMGDSPLLRPSGCPMEALQDLCCPLWLPGDQLTLGGLGALACKLGAWVDRTGSFLRPPVLAVLLPLPVLFQPRAALWILTLELTSSFILLSLAFPKTCRSVLACLFPLGQLLFLCSHFGPCALPQEPSGCRRWEPAFPAFDPSDSPV